VGPSIGPSISPSSLPTSIPTVIPTAIPSQLPSVLPFVDPSQSPSFIPTLDPSIAPTEKISAFVPSYIPSVIPSAYPSVNLVCEPSTTPTFIPSSSSPTGNLKTTTSSDTSGGALNSTTLYGLIGGIVSCLFCCLFLGICFYRSKYMQSKDELAIKDWISDNHESTGIFINFSTPGTKEESANPNRLSGRLSYDDSSVYSARNQDEVQTQYNPEHLAERSL
jgi:hypothetical protein